MSKSLKVVFIAVGILLLIWTVLVVDMKAVGAMLAQMGFGFLAVIAIYSVVTWVDAVAWKYGFKPEEAKSFKLWELWRIRQIGESFNTITPLRDGMAGDG